MHYFIIYNKTSGNRRNNALVSAIVKAMRAKNLKIRVIATKYKGHAAELTRLIASQFGDRATAIVMGGDGTISEAASGLVGTKTPLMAIPCGSGNDFAKKLYGRKFTASSVAGSLGLLKGEPHYITEVIDTVNANGHTCVNVLSIGFDTVVETTAHKLLRKFPFLGKRAYDLSIVLSIFGKLKYDYVASAKLYDTDAAIPKNLSVILLALCNASFYGGGYCPAPNSSLTDGILDLIYVDPVSISRIAALILPYQNGQIYKIKEAHEHKVTELYVKAKGGKVLYNCDGENYLEDSLNVRAVPKSLSICLPE